MSMMRMRIGKRYTVKFPDGRLVSGLCQKIDPGFVILNSRLASRVIPREDLRNTTIEEQ